MRSDDHVGANVRGVFTRKLFGEGDHAYFPQAAAEHDVEPPVIGQSFRVAQDESSSLGLRYNGDGVRLPRSRKSCHAQYPNADTESRIIISPKNQSPRKSPMPR